MRKRLIALILAVGIMIGILSGCPNNDLGTQTEEDRDVTRGEWVAMLGDAMGMTEYANDEAYFADVDPEDDIFPYVQSCQEWGVFAFEEDGQFLPDEPATAEFMAVTAALASSSIGEEEGISEDEVLEYAAQVGLVGEGDDPSDSVSLSDAQDAAETAVQVYLDTAEEDVAEIDFADGVVDLSATDPDDISYDGPTVTMPADVAQVLTTDRVFIAPGDAMNPFGIAMKVTEISIQGDNAVIQTVQPELEELFDSYKVYGSGAPDLNSVQTVPGVSMGTSATNLSGSAQGNGYVLDDLVYSDDPVLGKDTAHGLSLNFSVNFTKGTISVAPQWNDNKVTVERLIPEQLRARGDIGMSPSDDLGKIFEKSNFNATTIPLGTDENGNPRLDSNGMEKVLTVSDKFKGGYELTGNVGLNDVYVETGFEFKKVFGIPVGIRRVVVEVNCKTQIDVTFKGTLSEEVTIASFPVPIAGGLSVGMELVLYVDLDGEVQLRTELSHNTKFEYNNGNLKKVTNKDASTSLEAAVNLEFGAAPTAILEVFGIDIIDVKVKIGVHGGSAATLQYGMTEKKVSDGNKTTDGYTLWGQIVLKTKVSLPVITLETGTKKTLANKLSITGSWDLVSKDKAPITWEPAALNHKWPLFELEIPGKVNEPDENGENAEGENETWWASDTSQLDLKEYTVFLDDAPYQLELDLHGSDTTPKVRWESDRPSVATVDSKGLVTPHDPGFATITVSLKDDPNVYVKCTVYVESYSNKDWEFLPADLAFAV